MASLGSLVGILRLDASGFNSDARKAGKAARELNRRVAKSGKTFRTFGKQTEKLSGQVRGLGKSLLGVAAVAASGLGFVSAITTMAAFGKEMATLRGLTRATASEIGRLEAQALKLGKTSIFTASEAAQAQVTLARVGLSTNAILEATPAILSLAQSSSIGLAEASDLLFSALSGMGKGAQDAGKYVNLLSVSANTSNQTVTQLGQAFSYAAPAARILGVSAETLGASIGVLSDAAIKGDRAGTGLRQTFIKLSNVNAGAERTLAKYGLSLRDIDVASRGFVPVLESLRDAGLGASTAFGDLTQIFEARASSAVAILIGNLDKLRTRLVGINKETQAGSQYAAELARIQDNTLSGALRKVASAWEGVILAFGKVIGSGLQEYLEGVAQNLRDISDRTKDLKAIGDAFQSILEVLIFVAQHFQHVLNAILALIAVKVLAGIYALATAFLVVAGAIRASDRALLSFNLKQKKNFFILGAFALIEGYQYLMEAFSSTGNEADGAAGEIAKAGDAAKSLDADIKKLTEDIDKLTAGLTSAGAAAGDLPKKLGLANVGGAGSNLPTSSTDFTSYQDQARLAERELKRTQAFHAYQQKQLLNRRAILTEYQALARQISGALTGSLSDGIKNFVRGSGTLKEILAGVATRLSDVLLDSVFAPLEKGLENLITSGLEGGIGKALGEDLFGELFSDLASGLGDIFSSAFSGLGGLFKGLFSGIGASIGTFLGFAEGGRVRGGQPILVGERGPEIFTPPTSGTIIPNDQLVGATGAGSIQVNFTFQVNSTDGPGVQAALERAQPTFTRLALEAVTKGVARGGSQLRQNVRNAV